MLGRVLPALAALLLLSTNVLAQTPPNEAAQARNFPVPPVRARAAVVMDASNGAVLAAVNPHLRLPIASTTKIMTALVALQRGHLTDRITVPPAAFDYESDATVMGPRPGQVVTLRDLLYGLMLPSGADAANTIAIHYGGSESGFVALMNREAAALGMRETHYVNAHGLTARNHYSSAYDLAVLAQYVSYLPDLMRVASARTYAWGGHKLTNLNRVLFWYSGVDGIKPGYTDDAGICQVLDARRGGRHIVVVLLNTPNLVTDARNLLNFGLRDLSWQQSTVPGDGAAVLQSGADRSGPYVYFPGSGHYVRGKLLTAYVADGGLAALGFPRSEPLAEGRTWVQFFQNAALSLDPATGRVSRLALGLTPLPTSPTPVGTPTAPSHTPTPVPPTPQEATIVARRAADKPMSLPALDVTPTATPRPRATGTKVATPGPTPTTPGPVATDRAFVPFQQAHRGFLGNPVAPSRTIHGYLVQTFAYGALVRDNARNAVMLLPIGDRLLGARRYLPDHPGNAYPLTFAPGSVLKAIGWLLPSM